MSTDPLKTPCRVHSCHYYAHACRNPAHRKWWVRLVLRLGGDR